MSRTTRLALDVALFVAIVACSNPTWTGISLHEWLGIAIVVPALFHLVINWDWVERAFESLLGKIQAASAANLVVDSVLFVAAVAVTLSGFLVWPAFMAPLGGEISRTWIVVHDVASDITIVALLGHFALHARWFARAIAAAFTRKPARVQPQPQPLAERTPR
jgi:hypothetical protein